MTTKSIFKSRTAAVAVITATAGLVACFNDSAAQFVRDHCAGILTTLGLLNLALRRVTHGRVQFFPDESGGS